MEVGEIGSVVSWSAGMNVSRMESSLDVYAVSVPICTRWRWHHLDYRDFVKPTNTQYWDAQAMRSRVVTEVVHLATFSPTHSFMSELALIYLPRCRDPIATVNPRCSNLALALSTLWGLTTNTFLVGSVK